MSGTCSTCGKIITQKGEKGDPGEKGDTGAAGAPGTNGGAATIENYNNTMFTDIYTDGVTPVSVPFGTGTADNQDIYYNGTLYFELGAATNLKCTPYHAATDMTAQLTNGLAPYSSGTSYFTFPVAGYMTVGTGEAFGFKLLNTDVGSALVLRGIDINFQRV